MVQFMIKIKNGKGVRHIPQKVYIDDIDALRPITDLMRASKEIGHLSLITCNKGPLAKTSL